MTFLPIVGRELRVGSRQSRTYWGRSLVAAVAILIGLWIYAMSFREPPRTFGMTLFRVLSSLSLAYCVLAGIRSTSDSLSAEKRDGTLGLLFLTDLKGYDVVFGKLAVTSLTMSYGIFALFPILAIPLLMGGVTQGEFWRMTLVLLNSLFLSLTCGIFVSSISHFPRRAMAGTFVLLFIMTIGLPAIGGWIAEYTRKYPTPFLYWCSVCPFVVGFDREFARAGNLFWISSAVIHGTAWIFLILASIIVRNSWHDKPAGVGALKRREAWRSLIHGSAGARKTHRQRLLDINAIFWLAARARSKPAFVWLVLGIVALLWIWGFAEYGKDWFSQPVYFMTGLALNGILKFWIASEATRRFAEDRRIGALELILSTPLTVREIVAGQLHSLRRQFLGPVLVVIFAELLFMLAGLADMSIGNDRAIVVSFWAVLILTFVIDVIALCWVGMWVGLTARNPNRATGIAIGKVVILPWIIFAIFMMLVALGSRSGGPGWEFLLGFWFFLGIINCGIQGARASSRLHSEFRTIAVQKIAAKQSIWKKLFGGEAGNVPGSPPVIAS